MIYENVGRRITECRKEIGLSVPDLAHMLGMSRATLYRYENGDIKHIKMPVIESIARVLNVNPLWLIGKSDTKTEMEIRIQRPYKDVRFIMCETITYFENQEGMVYDGTPIEQADKHMITSMLQSLVDSMDARYR